MKHILLVVATLYAHCALAQPPNAAWLATAGGFNDEDMNHSAADGTGHLFIAGLGGFMDFGNGVIIPGSARAIARYDTLGNISWARGLTMDPDAVTSIEGIAATSNGDLWVTGIYQTQTIMLDTFVLTTNNGTTCAYLARLDSTGAMVFATSWGIGGIANTTTSEDICVDDQGNVLVTGWTTAPSLTVDGVTLLNDSSVWQLYALKFDASGTALWGNESHAPRRWALGQAIGADALGNTYVSGRIEGVFVMGADTVGTDSVDAGVLIKLGPTGTVEYVHLLPPFYRQDITVDAIGNAYVCGIVQGTTVWGNDTLGATLFDGFVAAYAPDGNYRWVVGVQGTVGNEFCRSVVLDATQTGLLVSGTFREAAWFGDVYMETDVPPTDGFVMQVDTTGSVEWVKDLTGDGATLIARAFFDPSGHLYTSGVTESNTTYLGKPVLNGVLDHAFLARFDDILMAVPQVTYGTVAQLHPNPCNGTFTMDTPANARAVVITDAQGRVLQNIPLAASHVSTFHIGAPGVYSVCVITETGSEVRRVIVK
ncbi:MAG: T9SS type A sorting domain-containing protein [Flavobacteriales bacterium]